jgi:hypothetical protein
MINRAKTLQRQTHPPKKPRNVLGPVAVVLLLTLVFCAGCSEPELAVKYGKVNEKPLSINSTSLFAKRLESQGFDVTVRNRISPKIDQFDIVFWFPETTNCPSKRAIEALENWLSGGYSSKTLVYVSGDYRADEDYLREVYRTVDASQKPEILRRLAEARLRTRRGQPAIDFFGTSRDSCDWFDIEAVRRKRSNQLSGPLTTGIAESDFPELEIGSLLVPPKPAKDTPWSSKELLQVDGESLIYRLTQDDSSYNENQIIVVNNASFLVNFALIDPKKQAFADALILEATSPDDLEGFGFSSRVLILESGPGDIPVRSTDYVNRTQWAWIAERPLCYIVPHALFWGVLFCFVYFPIFGRPQPLPKKSTTSFRSHVNAIGKQLERSGALAQAREAIRHYQKTVSDSGTRKNQK